MCVYRIARDLDFFQMELTSYFKGKQIDHCVSTVYRNTNSV